MDTTPFAGLLLVVDMAFADEAVFDSDSTIIIDKMNKCNLHPTIIEFLADDDCVLAQRGDVDFIIFQTKEELEAAKNLHRSIGSKQRQRIH